MPRTLSKPPPAHAELKGIEGVRFGTKVNLVVCNNPYDVLRVHAMLDEVLRPLGEPTASRLLPPSFGMDMRIGTIREWMSRIYGDGGQWWLVSMTPHVIDHVVFCDRQEVADHLHIFNGGRIQNVGAQDALDVYRSYEVGTQFVSEILRNRDMLG
jgi:hypothetical protein